MARTSDSLNRTALPALDTSITSCVPSVTATPTSVLPSSSSSARSPAARSRANCFSGVFFTVPLAVAMKTNLLPSKSRID